MITTLRTPRADSGSWSWVKWVNNFGWVTRDLRDPPKVVDALTVDPFYIVLIRYLL